MPLDSWFKEKAGSAGEGSLQLLRPHPGPADVLSTVPTLGKLRVQERKPHALKHSAVWGKGERWGRVRNRGRGQHALPGRGTRATPVLSLEGRVGGI